MAIRLPLEILHEGQQQVALSQARFKVLAAGRRWGKTRLATALCTGHALERRQAWWVAPTYPIATIGWRLLKELASQVPGWQKSEVERRIELPDGGIIQAKSADNPDSLRGEGLDFVVLDEAAFIKEEAWSQALRPALSDRQGRALFISTPRGRNWFFDLYNDAQGREDWQAWQFPTSANPHIAPEEIESARSLLPALIFAQEYEAQFTSSFGAMFKREWFRDVLPTAPLARYVRYWDLAASPEGDYSVGAKVGLTDPGQIVIADIVRERLPWPELRRLIGAIAQQDGPDVGVGIEQVAFQLAAVQSLRSMPDLLNIAIRGVAIHQPSAAVKALYSNLPTDKQAKAARAAGWLARAEAEQVSLVRGGWNSEFLAEICDFPLGQYDDQVDAVSGAVAMLARGTVLFGAV